MYWSIAARVAPYMAVAMLAGSAAWIVQGWRANSTIQEMKAAHARAQALAESQARSKEAELNEARQKAEIEYAKSKRKVAVDLTAAQAELDRLRDTIDFRSRETSSDTPAATCTYGTATERELLGACARSLVTLAADADELRAQVLGLQSYIRGVCK